MNKRLATVVVTLALTVGAGLLVLAPAGDAPGPAAPAQAAPGEAEPAALSAPRPVAAQAAAPGVQSVGATIPRVVLAREVGPAAGRLRTPVLLTDPGIEAVARVVGGPAQCSRELVPATVVWVDCAVPSGALRLEVIDGSGAVLVSRDLS